MVAASSENTSMEVNEMLRIGDFSKLSRVSIRMLRHYDDIGLLKPAETDGFTGYRYYREDQLFIVARITALKDMGFALADIVRVLEIYDDKEKLTYAQLLKVSKSIGTALTAVSPMRRTSMCTLVSSGSSSVQIAESS